MVTNLIYKKYPQDILQNKVIFFSLFTSTIYWKMNSPHWCSCFWFSFEGFCEARASISDIGPQSCMELCQALHKLLELRPLLWIQGPTTCHHCK